MEAQVKITVNVHESSSATVPNAGIFVDDNYSSGAAVLNIGGGALVLVFLMMLAVAAFIFCRKKIKKQKMMRVLSTVTGLALLLNFFTAFIYFDYDGTSAIDMEPSILDISTNNELIDVELEDEPVYATGTSTVTINEATEYGYTLFAYVENADLVAKNATDSTQKISSLPALEAETKLSDNTWGVALSKPDDQDSEVFIGLPDDAENPMVIKEVLGKTEAGDSTDLYVATYVTPGLAPGIYTGATIHYKALVHPGFYMQDFTKDQCQTLASTEPLTVYDRRDGSDYTVRYIDNRCWMTQNLRISGTISAELSNFETSPYSGSDTIDLYAGGDFKDTNDTFTAPMMHVADADDVEENDGIFTAEELGAYYNYCAASAGQVCGKVQVSATQDICPSGWRLPTGGTSSEQDRIRSSGSVFTPVRAGGYVNTVLYGGIGYYWSSSARNATNHWDIWVRGNSITVGNINNDYGISVRCVRTD